MSAVTRLFGVLLSASEAGLWSQKSLVSVFQVARFAPVSHHCFWLSPLTGNERFILSGLNYIVPPDLVLTACPRSKPEGNRHTGGRGRNCRGEGQAIRTGKKKKKKTGVMSKLSASARPLHSEGLERKSVLRSYKKNCLLVCLFVFLLPDVVDWRQQCEGMEAWNSNLAFEKQVRVTWEVVKSD